MQIKYSGMWLAIESVYIVSLLQLHLIQQNQKFGFPVGILRDKVPPPPGFLNSGKSVY